MVNDTPYFSLLPLDVSESVLSQAVLQLDQRTHIGTVPLVCQYWKHIGLRTSHSATAHLTSEAALTSLTTWLSKYGPSLLHLNIGWPVDFDFYSESPGSKDFQALLEAVSSSCINLQHLSVGYPPEGSDWPDWVVPPSLSSLTNLTRLSVPYYSASEFGVDTLTQLRSLTMFEPHWVRNSWSDYMADLVPWIGSLQQVQVLDAGELLFKTADLELLAQLPNLERLSGQVDIDMDLANIPLASQLPLANLGSPS
jgi:hypothetical protein